MLEARPLDLPAPALGGDTRDHDDGFEALDATLGRIRDTVNLGIDALNQGDRIHPNPDGARLIERTLWGFLEPLLDRAG